jgi:hypothetical protein
MAQVFRSPKIPSLGFRVDSVSGSGRFRIVKGYWFSDVGPGQTQYQVRRVDCKSRGYYLIQTGNRIESPPISEMLMGPDSKGGFVDYSCSR